MALQAIYTEEAAAKILWRLILTDRAKLEHFDEPSRGYEGDPAKLRNLAREYEHLKNDPSVLADVANYLGHVNPAPEQPPGEELDGVTLYDNDHPIPPELPF